VVSQHNSSTVTVFYFDVRKPSSYRWVSTLATRRVYTRNRSENRQERAYLSTIKLNYRDPLATFAP